MKVEVMIRIKNQSTGHSESNNNRVINDKLYDPFLFAFS